MNDVHLGSTGIEHDYNNHLKFNGAYIRLFGVIGSIVLLIACVNFVNLSLARATERWKEVGIRKAVGARRMQLIGQFTIESVVIALAALTTGLGMISIFLPFLNTAIGRELNFMTLFGNPATAGFVIGGAILVAVVAGTYPAIYLAAMRTTNALKRGMSMKPAGLRAGTPLVILQFTLAIGMIISTLIVSEQLTHMTHSDIGFSKDQIVLLDMNEEVNEKFSVLKTEWMRQSGVTGVTASSQRIGNNFNGWGFKVQTDSGVYQFVPSNVNVDYDYLQVYEIDLTEGRSFSRDFPSDQGRAFIINETMAKELAMKDPVGTAAGHAWYENNELGTIIGVAKDFNYNSLHNRIGMLAMVCHPEWGYEEISIKVSGDRMQETLSSLKAVWDKNISSYPFNYSFLDDHFSNLYRSEQQMKWAMSALGGCALAIGCIGLLGLANNLARRKVKEIGIRKVLGATSMQIASVMTGRFAVLVAIAFALAAPLAYLMMSEWLQNFSYRIDIGLTAFAIGGLTAMFFAIATVAYRVMRSGFENPVKSLRYE